MVPSPDIRGPLSVGNEEFAFSCDVTGLQTFETEYQKGIPLSTMAQWGFHTMPNPRGYTLAKYPQTMMSDANGKKRPYIYYNDEDATCPKEWKTAADYLYQNPGRLHLGRFAIDLSQSKDPRWRELERRIVLSRYLTRIQCAGSTPPQETGLTCNSWWGKFHLEMHWWHAAHFALWGNSELLERSLPWYQRILPKAQAIAREQGYEGARWPKCVGPAGDVGPTYLESFLIWQQPHPIFYCELAYRAHRNRETLTRYQRLVFETAQFMASFAAWDAKREQYRIGPPFSDAAEIYWPDFRKQCNGTFEIAYWRWSLETAQRWRQRLNLPREPKWDHVIAHLPPLPTRDGLYVWIAKCADVSAG